MPDYRAYIMGTDGHVQNRVDLQCDDDVEAIRLAKQLVDVTTLSCGIWIDTSTHSGTRPGGQYAEAVDYCL